MGCTGDEATDRLAVAMVNRLKASSTHVMLPKPHETERYPR